MKTIDIKISLKCLVGDKVIARNYRTKYGDWELGTVTDISTSINEDLTYRVSYTVRLDRKSKTKSRTYPNGGAPLIITVSENKIRKQR